MKRIDNPAPGVHIGIDEQRGLASARPAMTRLILATILALALLVRVGALWINHENRGGFWGDTLNAAEMGVQRALFHRWGVIDPSFTAPIHTVAHDAGHLVDPEDLGLRGQESTNPKPDFENHVGLGIIMGLVWSLTGDMRYIYIQILQLILDMGCVYLIFRAAWNILGNIWIALVSAGLYALFPIQVYMLTFPVSYTWMVFYGVLLIYILSVLYGPYASYRSTGRKWLLLAFIGFATGAFAHVRSNIVFMPLFLGVGFLGKERIRQALIYALVILLVEILVLAPLLIRNYQAFGRLSPTRGVFWHTVWAGFGAHENPLGAVNNDQATAEMVLKEYPGIEKYGPEYENILKEKSLTAIKEHPLWFVRIMLERVLMIFVPEGWKALAVTPLLSTAFVGAIIAVQRGLLSLKGLSVYLLPTVYFFASIIVVYVPGIKHVMPAYPFLLTLAAVTLVEIAVAMNQRWQEKIQHA